MAGRARSGHHAGPAAGTWPTYLFGIFEMSILSLEVM